MLKISKRDNPIKHDLGPWKENKSTVEKLALNKRRNIFPLKLEGGRLKEGRRSLVDDRDKDRRLKQFMQ